MLNLLIRVKFLTTPIFCPSGVSAGQKKPKCVLCKSLNLTDFDELLMGYDTRLKCDRVAK